MSDVQRDDVLKEKIRHLAVEQMSEGVLSIVMTRVANGSIEVNIVRDFREFGTPACGYVDKASKEFVTEH
jgi:hypothetical protein